MLTTDQQVRQLRRLDAEGTPAAVAALRSGMDAKTARKYRRLGRLPSEVRMPHSWRTHPDPFADVWAGVVERLALNPGLEALTLFRQLQREHPGVFPDGQLRTFQRRVKTWRATHGPAKEVFFAQVHTPGRLCASDFTHMTDLRVTINGRPFDHLIYHFVLTYSNWETGTVCFAESFESLAGGLQNALAELGGVPAVHRTDRLTAAIPPGTTGAEFTQRYRALLAHYGLEGQAIQAGHGNENGDIEQRHRRFKQALDQQLLLRASRDFTTREAYQEYLGDLFAQLNANRVVKKAQEVEHLRALPARRFEAAGRVVATVDAGSTIHVKGNTYSVSSRLIGERVEVRLHAEHVEVWYAQKVVERMPRLRGRGQHRIAYRHVIDWLVRKPGAFAGYRYREELFPTTTFRIAYDVLRSHVPARADREYLRLLQSAASDSEVSLEAAIRVVLAGDGVPTAYAVSERMRALSTTPTVPVVAVGPVDLRVYDQLLRATEGTTRVEDQRDRDGDREPEGTGPADDASDVRGGGRRGAGQRADVRAVPAGPERGRGEPPPGEPDRAVAAGVEAAAGEELGGAGHEAAAGEGGASGEGTARRGVRGPARERAGVRPAGFGEDAPPLRGGAGTGAVGSEGVVHDVQPAGPGTAAGEAGAEAAEGPEAAGRLPGADGGRPGVRAAEPGGDGGAVHAAGGAVRAGERAADEQPGVLGVGGDLQGSDDDGGGHRPIGPSQRDRRAERAELPGRAGQEPASEDDRRDDGMTGADVMLKREV